MMRGKTQRREAVITWECSWMDDSPMTARRPTTSKDQPFFDVGNHRDRGLLSDMVTKLIGELGPPTRTVAGCEPQPVRL